MAYSKMALNTSGCLFKKGSFWENSWTAGEVLSSFISLGNFLLYNLISCKTTLFSVFHTFFQQNCYYYYTYNFITIIITI